MYKFSGHIRKLHSHWLTQSKRHLSAWHIDRDVHCGLMLQYTHFGRYRWRAEFITETAFLLHGNRLKTLSCWVFFLFSPAASGWSSNEKKNHQHLWTATIDYWSLCTLRICDRTAGYRGRVYTSAASAESNHTISHQAGSSLLHSKKLNYVHQSKEILRLNLFSQKTCLFADEQFLNATC